MSGLQPKDRPFPRSARLLEPRDFVRVARKGKQLKAEFLSVAVLENPEGTGPRLGLVASRKVGKAHDRNRLKRVVRETFRLEIAPTAIAVDMIVRFAPGAGNATPRKVREEFLKAVNKLGLVTPTE